jgi:hypothetical protein
MLSKSKASPYIVTLILSFVLSSYINNLLRIKLKRFIKNCCFVLNSMVVARLLRLIFLRKILARKPATILIRNHFLYINVESN